MSKKWPSSWKSPRNFVSSKWSSSKNLKQNREKQNMYKKVDLFSSCINPSFKVNEGFNTNWNKKIELILPDKRINSARDFITTRPY